MLNCFGNVCFLETANIFNSCSFKHQLNWFKKKEDIYIYIYIILILHLIQFTSIEILHWILGYIHVFWNNNFGDLPSTNRYFLNNQQILCSKLKRIMLYISFLQPCRVMYSMIIILWRFFMRLLTSPQLFSIPHSILLYTLYIDYLIHIYTL